MHPSCIRVLDGVNLLPPKSGGWGGIAERPIQVHDVQPFRALAGPTAGDRGRIVAEHGLRRGVSLPQPHNLPLAKVDCGENDQTHRYSFSER
jgi:hypothetical protein